MGAESTRNVYVASNATFAPTLNASFTFEDMADHPITAFALERARSLGFDQTRFANELGVKSQHVVHWKSRGIPANRHQQIAKLLGITVEQLLAAGSIPVPEPPLPPDAVQLARDWSQLRGSIRTQIQLLVQSLVEQQQARAEGLKSEVDDRAALQRRRRA